MRISLDRVDTRALRVDLPGPRNEAVAVRTAHGLRGTIGSSDDRLVLENVFADSVELDALRIALGDLVLSNASGAILTSLALSLDRTKSQLVLAVAAASIAAQDLDVAIDDVVVRGRVTLVAPELLVRDAEGSLSSERVEIADFLLRVGDVEVAAEMLVGLSVKIAWGAAGFRLVAGSLDAPSIRVTTADVQLAATAVAVTSLSLDGAAVSIGRVALQSGQVAVNLRSSSSRAPEAVPAPREPLFDWKALDTLSGQLDVDVAVDLTVPIIGQRTATHRLRVAIEDGALDYRALESNLAKLEDALLDFSVRDGALVLERVNPLFPARGHGKPVVIWDVDAAGLALAERDRVLLSVLPLARLASASEARDDDREPSKSSIVLRELGLLRINARLALARAELPVTGQLRPHHIGSFVLGGSVFHEPGGSREGSALGELSDLAASVHGLAIGTSRLDAASLTAAAVCPIEIAFTDVNPSRLQLGLVDLVVETIAVSGSNG